SKKLCLIFMVLLLVFSVWTYEKYKDEKNKQYSCHIGFLQYDGKDTFISSITENFRQEITEFQNENKNYELSLNVMDAMNDQDRQNMQAEHLLDLNYDILCVNLVERNEASNIISMAEEKGVPVVFFNREPVEKDLMRNDDIYYEGSDANESAILQAEIIKDAFEKKKIDKNEDGIIQCIMLEGEKSHQDAVIRSEIVLKSLTEAGVKLELLTGAAADWNRQRAGWLTMVWLSDEKMRKKTELIISNNDAMALGAIDSLDAMGIDDIRVVGIDGISEALNNVERKKMLGTVLCDTSKHARALMELVDAVVMHKEKMEELNLDEGKYYRIPLEKIEFSN
ncbi:MAG: galactose ABC transporter substrate-binding protein, partial [Lachnospiraceae bacterium]|nr:galactose ABC transporter substrate-binding protein [Lachnospiraceae bacterium]